MCKGDSRNLAIWVLVGVVALRISPGESRSQPKNSSFTKDDPNQGAEPHDFVSFLGDSTFSNTPLVIAARDGDLEKVKQLIAEGADLELHVKNVTALWIASALGRLPVVTELLSAGAEVDSTGPDSLTPLLAAAEAGYEGVIVELLNHGANIEAVNSQGSTPLLLAIIGAHPRAAKVLIQAGSDVNAMTDSGITSLFAAAFSGDLYLVKVLREAGADLHIPDSSGATPLFVAAQQGHRLVVHDLLQAGARVNKNREDGATPLHAAAAGCHRGVVELLLHKDANPLIFDKYGRIPADLVNKQRCEDRRTLYEIEAILRPLFHAAREGDAWVVSRLIDNGADVNSRLKSNSMTPLHIAAAHGRLTMVKILIDSGADRSAVDSSNNKPIDVIGIERAPEPEEADKILTLLHLGYLLPPDPPSNAVVVVPKEQPRRREISDPVYPQGNTNSMSPMTLMVVILISFVLGCILIFGLTCVGYYYYFPRGVECVVPENQQRCYRNQSGSSRQGSSARCRRSGSEAYLNPFAKKLDPFSGTPSSRHSIKPNRTTSRGSESSRCSTTRPPSCDAPVVLEEVILEEDSGSHQRRNSEIPRAVSNELLECAIDGCVEEV